MLLIDQADNSWAAGQTVQCSWGAFVVNLQIYTSCSQTAEWQHGQHLSSTTPACKGHFQWLSHLCYQDLQDTGFARSWKFLQKQDLHCNLPRLMNWQVHRGRAEDEAHLHSNAVNGAHGLIANSTSHSAHLAGLHKPINRPCRIWTLV